MVVVGLIAVLAGILLPALGKTRSRAHAIFSLNNTRQLTTAWLMYADDNNGQFAYNFGGDTNRLSSAPKSDLNWVNNKLTWDLNPDNTNTATITRAGIANYAGRSAAIYKCPADTTVSPIQAKAGWRARIRSFSLNAMIGDGGERTKAGYNIDNPKHAQIFGHSTVAGVEPNELFLFVDEHVDSIDDGYFLNAAYSLRWTSLPASHHNGAGTISFLDGHSELHRWVNSSTARPERPQAAGLPFSIPKTELADYNWVINHMSARRD